MRKRIAKTFVAAALITSIAGTSVWADDVTDLTNKKNAAESQLSQTQSELAYLLVQMDELEVKMHDKNEEIDQANADLAAAEQNMQNQYEAVYGDQIWSRSINGETLEDKVKNVVLARLAQIKTMNLLAESRQVTLSEEEDAAVLSAAETYFSSLNDTEVEKLGLTEKKTEDMYREYALANKIYDLIIQDTNPEISDDEARTVTLEQIMIKTYSQDGDGNRTPYTDASKALAKQRAENILRKLQSGEDFDTLAQTYNEESSITVSFGKGEKPKALEDAALIWETEKSVP